MKKGFIFSFIISLLLILGIGIFPTTPKKTFSNAASVEIDEQALIQELQNDDYSYTIVDKNITLANLRKQIFPSENNVSELSTNLNNQILTYNQISEFCSNNDLLLVEEESCYKIRNKFSLKRLLVNGSVSNTYDARKVIPSYNNVNILCYNTIEETKNAYLAFKSNNVDVMIDSIVSATDVKAQQVSKSSYYTWGANAMDISSYTSYLDNNGTSKEIVVAVLDTGINTSHEMFDNRLIYNEGKIVGFSYYSSTYNYSKDSLYFESTDTSQRSFEDDKGHGSHISGIICDLTPTNVKILPIKVLDSKGEGSFSAIQSALGKIYETYSNQYQIASVNLSLGGESTSSTELSNFNTAFTNLKNKNILSVVAAGNDKINTSTFLPAACGDSAIVVSALKKNENGTTITYEFDSSYSNFGTSIDICAPGSQIVSAYKAVGNSSTYEDQYYICDGTSQAAPHVSAVVALLCLDGQYYTNSNPSYTASEIEKRLFNNAVDYGDTGEDDLYGNGVLSLTDIAIIQDFEYTPKNCTTTYDGNYHNISVEVRNSTNYTISYSLTENGDYSITDITKYNTFKNYTNGTKTIYFKLSAKGFKTITDSANLTINQRVIEITPQNQTSTYGNSSHLDQSKYSITSGSKVSGDNLNISLNANVNQYSTVGDYTINVSYSNSNYNASTKTATLTIDKRPISICIGNSTSVYGEDVEIDNSNYTLSKSLIGTDKLGVVLNIEADKTSDVGTYPITLRSISNNNYKISSTTNGTHTITQRPISITLLNQSSIYGEDITINHNHYTITSGSIVNDDNLETILSTSAIENKAGSYDITLQSSNPNYSITVTIAKYVVLKKDLDITIKNQTFTYGEVNLDQTKYTVNSGNFAYNDKEKILLTTSATNLSNAGDYAIDLDFDFENYNVSLTKGTLTIEKRTLYITLNPKEVYYGDVLALEDSEFNLTNGTIVNNDDVNISLTSFAEEENYIITAESSNSNYTITILNNEISILPRKITISIQQTGTYGDEINLDNKDYEVVENSIINNDDLNLNISTTATQTSNVGTYPITLISANKNYEITLSKAEYKINPKTITIEINKQESSYGESVKLDSTKYSMDESQIINGNLPQITLSTNAKTGNNAGNYQITATNSNPNYKLTYTTGEYTITKRKISIRLYNQTTTHSIPLVFNENDYDIVAGSVLKGDELNVKVYTDANNFSFAGTYNLMATYNNENYEVTFYNAKLIVEFSVVDVLIIAIPTAIVLSALIIFIHIKRKKKAKENPLFTKWT